MAGFFRSTLGRGTGGSDSAEPSPMQSRASSASAPGSTTAEAASSAGTSSTLNQLDDVHVGSASPSAPATGQGRYPVPAQPYSSASTSSVLLHEQPYLAAREPPPMPPSPSSTSQSEDGDDVEDEDEEEEEEDLPSGSVFIDRATANSIGGARGKGKGMHPDAGLEFSREGLDRRNTITGKNGMEHPLLASSSVASGSRTSLLLRSPNGPGTPGASTNGRGTFSDADWGSTDGTIYGATETSYNRASPSNLPHEIMLHIFRYVILTPVDLKRCLLVCKSWCLSGVELLWHRPTFHKASTLYKMVHTLALPNQTFEYAPFIRRLNFSMLGEELDNATFSRMASCVRLERLTLAGCRKLSDATLSKVLSQTKQLVAIDLTDVAELSDNTIITLAEGCSRLQGINLTGCEHISSASIAQLAKNCKLLRRVKLCGCKETEDEAVTALAENCPLLLEVDLTGCAKVTDASVSKLWTHSTHLREFRLAQCSLLTDAAFPSPLSGNVRKSTVLSNGIVRAAIMPPEAATSGEAGFSVGEGGVNAIPGVTPKKAFDHLRILDLTNCSGITDNAIEGIVNNAHKIRNLILAKCSLLTDETVYSISRLGKNLHYLHLGRVDLITDRAVRYLARSCTRLRYVDLAYCPNLTDESVQELAHNLPKLRRIGLVKVQNLTDRAIYALVEKHTSLERIHLSYCDNITVPAVFWLLQRLDRLTHLSLTGVPAFLREELQSMCRTPPKEFNNHQRRAFCVYSGKGVNNLREYLREVYANQERAAQFGELPAEIASLLDAMAEQQRQRQQRSLNRYERHHGQHRHGPEQQNEHFSDRQPFSAADLNHLRQQYDHYMQTQGFVGSASSNAPVSTGEVNAPHHLQRVLPHLRRTSEGDQRLLHHHHHSHPPHHQAYNAHPFHAQSSAQYAGATAPLVPLPRAGGAPQQQHQPQHHLAAPVPSWAQINGIQPMPGSFHFDATRQHAPTSRAASADVSMDSLDHVSSSGSKDFSAGGMDQDEQDE